MSAPDASWWETRAGEYVLGTLDAKERELFVRVLRRDPDLQRSVRAWQTRFAPLDAAAPAREPPGRVWATIERTLRAEGGPIAHADDVESLAGRPVREEPDGAVVVPRDAATPGALTARGDAGEMHGGGSIRHPPPRRGLFVPFVAAFATAASLILGVLLHEERQRLEAFGGSILQADGISVILGEDGAPLWLVQADFEGERVRVTALAPPPVDGAGDYQLWQVLPDGGGVAAVSLLPDGDGESRDTPVPGLARAFDAFAVSLEPEGGSPEPTPTGTVLYQGGVTFTDEENGS